ncbi:MAG TPA: ATP-dependent metallopeptidase FtsH/Yme1/Tma family protein, partial [Acidimicrobiales bacterium]|nr:ATP-dependent metallopeptidase FtsH/Yme1/Tma family protein [Acidimicrobiales bacterium]
MSRQPGDLRPGGQPERRPSSGLSPDRNWRWVAIVLGALIVIAFILSGPFSKSSSTQQSYSDFQTALNTGQVKSATVNNDTGHITYTDATGKKFTVPGPKPLTDSTVQELRTKVKDLKFVNQSSNFLASLLPFLLYGALIIGFFLWMSRRAQGQMTGIMSIGRSKAKVYTTERPRTTFSDVAGYNGVKLEIREVVDFLRSANRFKEIGARIPKGVLLVGPPGTGKTLLARAVAGEAGVPFLSVTGSDFMEMFVGVGASRVRDLFQTARKQAPAIIFVDEIDSIGRKRGAGLGGGHDEREQTLNQMLAEMDGVETTEGIVMMA